MTQRERTSALSPRTLHPACLEGKVVLVTGAGRNTGRTIALTLAALGADVAVCAATREAEVLATADAVSELGRRALPFVVDVRDRASVSEMVGKVVEQLGTIDVLVNAASARPLAPFLEVTIEDWQRALDVNLTGAFNCCQAVVPHMIRQGSGSIVNISGSVVPLGGANTAATGAAKAGLHGLTRSLATELGPAGIRVNILVPHVIDTPTRTTPLSPGVRETYLAEIPLGRFASTEDVANMVAVLAADFSSYITGQTIHVSGGRTMAI